MRQKKAKRSRSADKLQETEDAEPADDIQIAAVDQLFTKTNKKQRCGGSNILCYLS